MVFMQRHFGNVSTHLENVSTHLENVSTQLENVLWGMSGASSIWGMSGALAGACLAQNLKACLGQSKIFTVLHASLMPVFTIVFYVLSADIVQSDCALLLRLPFGNTKYLSVYS